MARRERNNYWKTLQEMGTIRGGGTRRKKRQYKRHKETRTLQRVTLEGKEFHKGKERRPLIID